jgi:SAM-dependent MidA family methyltransferase
MKPSTQAPVGPAMLAALRRRAAGGASLSFADFMEVALYEPGIGYYRRERPRVGYAPGTDFFTASSSPLFGRLVAAASAAILAPGRPSDFDFVEIGAERGRGVLGGHAHPFRSARSVGVGEPVQIKGPSIVFSNELFDAQPFRRFRFRSGKWRELGVALAEGGLTEVEVEAAGPLPAELPAEAEDGYTIDAPFAAAALARRIAAEPWTGLFLAFDYGKSWEEIAHETPAGTARAYRRHAQASGLLDRPGEQDLTCHVCWDWLRASLADAGFRDPRVESQEAFLAGHSGDAIRALAEAEAGRLSRDKLSLLQLLHPAHMGQRFQALWAVRPQAPPAQNPLASRSRGGLTSSF